MGERSELHLKYRPKSFEDFLGNEALKESVLSVLDRTRTFLFYGPRGCGKTTLALLLGIQLGIDPFDTNEIDAADDTGVDAARAIKTAAQYLPMNGKYKIYIIDEVHRLTGNAFDSLLKTLEAPPEHCYFVLCTTELQKVPATIKSRAKCYEVRTLTEKEQNYLIRWICHEEGFKISAGVKQSIIESCDGVPREIIVAMDIVRDVKDEQMAISLIHASVHRETKELCQALLNQADWPQIAALLKELKDEPERIRMAILGYMNAVLLNSTKVKNPVADMAAMIIEQFSQTFIYNGKAGLSYACYMCQIK